MEEQKPKDESKEEGGNETKQQLVTCPCCGKPTLAKPLKVADKLLDEWVACLASNVPFTHVYSLADGKITLTLSTPTLPTQESMVLVAQLLSAMQQIDWQGDCPVNLVSVQRALNLFSYIKEITIKTAEKTSIYMPQQLVDSCLNDIVALKKEILDKKRSEAVVELAVKLKHTIENPELVSSLPISMMAAAVTAHTTLDNLLVEAGFDSGFWTGIELA